MFDSMIGPQLTVESFLLCTLTSIALGLGTAFLCRHRSTHSQGFLVTLAMVPPVVQLVIMMVNGSVGAGVAVAGAFGLVRFRSMPGSAREIGMLFLAVAMGLACGMGYVFVAGTFFLIMALYMLILSLTRFGRAAENQRELRITIPEELDYEGLFEDVFREYTTRAELEWVRTTNMGTLYELRYRVCLKKNCSVRSFLDALRCRNGNLNIGCGRICDKNQM